MIIEIHCPDCGRLIKIDIATIDRLKAENRQLSQKIFELENQIRAADLFGNIFRG